MELKTVILRKPDVTDPLSKLIVLRAFPVLLVQGLRLARVTMFRLGQARTPLEAVSSRIARDMLPTVRAHGSVMLVVLFDVVD